MTEFALSGHGEDIRQHVWRMDSPGDDEEAVEFMSMLLDAADELDRLERVAYAAKTENPMETWAKLIEKQTGRPWWKTLGQQQAFMEGRLIERARILDHLSKSSIVTVAGRGGALEWLRGLDN